MYHIPLFIKFDFRAYRPYNTNSLNRVSPKGKPDMTSLKADLLRSFSAALKGPAGALQDWLCYHSEADIKIAIEGALAEEAEKSTSPYRAARLAYASEFALDEQGLPDVGSIHANIRALKQELAQAKAREQALVVEVKQLRADQLSSC